MKLNILAGGNVAFIATYLFDNSTGTLDLVRKNLAGQGTSWIERSVVNPTILYAVNEIDPGAIQSFRILELDNGILSDQVSITSSGGAGPAFVLASTDGLVIPMNFGGGNGAIINTTNSGTNFGDSQFITFPIVGASNLSHPHQALQFEDEILIPDLGGDTIWRLVRDQTGNFTIGGEIVQDPGSGPRHAVINNNTLITLHELSSTLTSQTIPPLGQNSSNFISNISIIPDTQANLPGFKFQAAEVLMPPPCPAFPSTIVYASNRNTGTANDTVNGDAIAIFSLDGNGNLKLENQFFTGLQQVRGMQFGGPDNRFLVASGVVGDGGVVVFERTGQGFNFTQVASNKEIPNLTSFVWV